LMGGKVRRGRDLSFSAQNRRLSHGQRRHLHAARPPGKSAVSSRSVHADGMHVPHWSTSGCCRPLERSALTIAVGLLTRVGRTGLGDRPCTGGERQRLAECRRVGNIRRPQLPMRAWRPSHSLVRSSQPHPSRPHRLQVESSLPPSTMFCDG
jgi:hypothetical protein